MAVCDVVEPTIYLCVEERGCVAAGLNIVRNRIGITRFVYSSDGDTIKQDAAECKVCGDLCQNEVKRLAGKVQLNGSSARCLCG